MSDIFLKKSLRSLKKIYILNINIFKKWFV